MNWLSKKIIVSKLRNYFHLENEGQVTLQILGQHNIKCENLILRNEVINNNNSLIHVQHCLIKHIEICYDSSKEQPINLRLNGASLVLKFNDKKAFEPSQASKMHEDLKDFFSAITSKDTYRSRSFLQEEIFQFKNLVSQFFIGKINLAIQNIHVSLEYCKATPAKFIGVKIKEISIKQRLLLKNREDVEMDDAMRDQQINCELNGVALYLGILTEVNKIEKEATHREILRKAKQVNKKYLLEEQLVNIYYNTRSTSLSVVVEQFEMNLTRMLVCELTEVVNYIGPFLSDRPTIRPGQGQLIDFNGRKMKDGTLRWWSYILNRTVQLIQQSRQLNMLTSRQFRQYLYCLMHQYTFGKCKPLTAIIDCYQQLHTTIKVMKCHHYIIDKIHSIRQSALTDPSLSDFVRFLANCELFETISSLKLKKLTYDKVHTSKFFVNVTNSQLALDEYEKLNNLKLELTFHIKSLAVKLVNLDCEAELLRHFMDMKPSIFLNQKCNLIKDFCQKMWGSPSPTENKSVLLILRMESLMAIKSDNELKLSLASLRLFDCNNTPLVVLDKVRLASQIRQLELKKNHMPVSERKIDAKVGFWYVNLQKQAAEIVLSIHMLLNKDKIDSQKPETGDFVMQQIYQEMPKNKIFDRSGEDHVVMEVTKLVVVTSLFGKDKYLCLKVNNIGYTSQAGGTERLFVEKTSICRSTFDASFSSAITSEAVRAIDTGLQSVIMENSNAFAGYISNSKSWKSLSSSIEIVIPFLLVQLSCLDMFYFCNLLHHWAQVKDNQHYFAKTKAVPSGVKRQVEFDSKNIRYAKNIKKSFTRSSIMDVKLDGLELVVYGDNSRTRENQILSILLGMTMYTRQKCFLSYKEVFLIENVFVKNCLGKSEFNTHRLVDLLKSGKQVGEPLIYRKQEDTTLFSLVMYNQRPGQQTENSSVPFLRAAINNNILLEELKRSKIIDVQFSSFFIFHSPDYFQVLWKILYTVNSLAKERVIGSYKPAPTHEDSVVLEHEYLFARNFHEMIELNCSIEKVNIIVLFFGEPVYAINLSALNVTHCTQLYVLRYHIVIESLSVIDISIHSGPHPTLFRTTTPTEARYVSYNSHILRQKYQRSALFTLVLTQPEIFFLNRKIKELVNFINSNFVKRTTEDAPDQQLEGDYPFCFKIEIVNAFCVLIRNSLSAQSMACEIESIVVANFSGYESEQHVVGQTTQHNVETHQDEEDFTLCSVIHDNDIQFHSFHEEGSGDKAETDSKIQIKIHECLLYSNADEHSQQIIAVPLIAMEMVANRFMVHIESLDAELTSADYLFLIRLTEENFAQIPLIFVRQPMLSEEKNVDFSLCFSINTIQLDLKHQRDEPPFGRLLIHTLEGQSCNFTNGERLDEIEIGQITFECPLEIIISSKHSTEELSLLKDTKKTEPLLGTFNDLPNCRIYETQMEQIQKQKCFATESEGQHNDQRSRINVQPANKDETNVGRVSKWICGMCNKCFCCLRQQNNQQLNEPSPATVRDEDKGKVSKKDVSPVGRLRRQVHDLNEEHIVHDEQILDFTSKINSLKYARKKKTGKNIFMSMETEQWKEKRIYLLVQGLDIILQNNFSLMTLIGFLKEPYTCVENKTYLESHFNNLRPSQLLIELADCSLSLLEHFKQDRKSLVIDMNLKYNMEKFGDLVNGPGRSVNEIDIFFRLLFENKQTLQIQLTDLICLTFRNDQTTKYRNKEPINSLQRIIMFSSADSGRINFTIPASVIKPLQDLITGLSVGKKSQSVSKPARTVSTVLAKVNKVRRFYVPELQVSIQSKKHTSFFNIIVSKILYQQKDSATDSKSSNRSHIVRTDLMIEYWNLSIGKFEPLLEPWGFEIKVKSMNREHRNNTQFRMLSRPKAAAQQQSKQYKNGLNINISSALFHTFKELQLKYRMGIADAEDVCFDLTKKDTQVYKWLTKKESLPRDRAPSSLIAFPEELKNFFGKKFKVGDLNSLKKKIKKSNLGRRFHQAGMQVFLYHSYLDSNHKCKNITYRTPFRIINISDQQVSLSFTEMNYQQSWQYSLACKQFYALPEDIYFHDFLVHIDVCTQANKKSLIRSETMLTGTLSARYLVQMHALKSEYTNIDKNKLYQRLFNVSSYQSLFIDRRDVVIRTEECRLVLVNIKCESEYYKGERIDAKRIILYDSITVIVSPITIYNNSLLTFHLIVGNSNGKVLRINPGERLEINKFSAETKLQNVTVEFTEDILHTEFSFFRQSLSESYLTMRIDRLQSITLRVTQQTYHVCNVELYSDWIIRNETGEDFQLAYDSNQFPVDQYSISCLTIPQFHKRTNCEMAIKIYDPYDENSLSREFAVNDNLIDLFELTKSQIRMDLNRITVPDSDSCCFNSGKQNTQFLVDGKVKQTISLAITIDDSSICKLTKTLTIRYRYLMRNLMKVPVKLYQHQLECQMLILKPKEENYIYSYNFLPVEYFLTIVADNAEIRSNMFCFDKSWGRSVSLKLKKERKKGIGAEYLDDYVYIRIDVEQTAHCFVLNLKLIDEHINFPIYIENSTPYLLKISENGDSFQVKAKTRVPFSWSNLINNKHELQVEVEGITKVYSLEQQSEFEPILLMQQTFGDKVLNRFKKPAQLFKKQECQVVFEHIIGRCLLILDLFTNQLHLHAQEDLTLDIMQDTKMVVSARKIELWFAGRGLMEVEPSLGSIEEWIEMFRYAMNRNVSDKIFFTIESLQNSIIFFIHNSQIGNENDFRIDRKEFFIDHLFISVVHSDPVAPEEVILIFGSAMEFTQQDRLCEISGGEQKSFIRRSKRCFRINKIKINNQLVTAVNPVILSQIKKSNFPFVEVRIEKQNLLAAAEIDKPDGERDKDDSSNQVDHYKSVVLFLDEAEVMVEAALFPQLLEIRKSIEQIQKQYSSEQHDQRVSKVEPMRRQSVSQVYMNFMEIKPIKMTVSVSFDANIKGEFEPNWINFLALIPSGVENAIIAVDSYIFHHIDSGKARILSTLRQSYLFEIKKQILYNAGSLQIFAPIQLVQGLGIGMKNIFYNPIYELVNKQQLKAATSTLLEGILSFFIFLFMLGFQIVNAFIKFLAVFTFDRNFQAKREMFRKQIFKSPVDAIVYGGRYFIRIVKQYFLNFVTLPCDYNKKTPCLGVIWGLILSLLNTLPWLIKIIVTIYDFFYVVGLGLLSWGYYEANSMKYRSRPIRTFPQSQIVPYNFLEAKGNDIMRQNQIRERENEEISFVDNIEIGEQSKYLILSNYRILYSENNIGSSNEILLYRVTRVSLGAIKRHTETHTIVSIDLRIHLIIPNRARFICCDYDVTEYTICFKNYESLSFFLAQLRMTTAKMNLQIEIEADDIETIVRPQRAPGVHS